jgi:crotonobetainyl-CoA:carnitine CoA-transferase CaiB-like acyl-CoA transferase
VSLLDVAMHLQAAPFTEYLETGSIPQRSGNAAPMTAPADLMRTKDGYLVLSAYLDGHWRALCHRIERPDLIENELYATQVARLAHRAELLAILEDALSARTTTEWLSLLEQDGLLVGVVKDYADVVATPQVTANEAIIEVGMSGGGTFRTIRLPARYTSWQPVAPSPPPNVGEHGGEVLSGLGYSEAEIQDLVAAGAVVAGDRDAPQKTEGQ